MGNERDGLIYLMQEKRFKLLGFQKPPILEILGSDFRTHKLLLENDLVKMDQIEISFADGRDFKLVKQDQGFWAVGGDREKKFEARKTYWVTEPFVISDYLGYLTERPINFERYGLQPPRAKLRFYSGGQLFLEVWVGNWEAGKAKCYAYLPGPDQLIWFNFDLAGKIPPDPGVFLSKKE